MLMVCHHLDPSIPEDVAFAESRIRKETIAAEDILHDLGALSMMSSDSQAMGRVGEVIIRTWQTADKMKRQRGAAARATARQRQPAGASATSPNTRSTRPSRTASREHIGSVEAGKLADLVLWTPAFFGVKPDLVLKGGIDRGGADGRPQRLDPDAAAGALPADVRRLRQRARRDSSLTFVSQAALDDGLRGAARRRRSSWSRSRTCAAASRKKIMIHNDATPDIEVDPETYEVRADGELLTCEPADGAADGAAVLPVLSRMGWFERATMSNAGEAAASCRSV